MSDVLDKIHDLAHHAYDTVTGMLSAPSAPAKPAATAQDASQHLGNGLAANAASNISGRQKQIDDAVDAASR